MSRIDERGGARRWSAAVLVTAGLLCHPGAASAQIDFFLYQTGTLLFLDQAKPQSPASMFTASPPVSFWFGNPWKEVGTWSTPLALGSFVAVGPAGDLHVSVGLKNSDGIGTAFDLRAQVWVQGAGDDPPVLVAEGTTHCIAGVARDLSRLKEVVVPFTSTDTTFLHGTERVTLKVLTRIGTGPIEDKRCTGRGAGHVNAGGLRVYFGGVSQPSRFNLLIAIP